MVIGSGDINMWLFSAYFLKTLYSRTVSQVLSHTFFQALYWKCCRTEEVGEKETPSSSFLYYLCCFKASVAYSMMNLTPNRLYVVHEKIILLILVNWLPLYI